jgi:hypothetical protein
MFEVDGNIERKCRKKVFENCECEESKMFRRRIVKNESRADR